MTRLEQAWQMRGIGANEKLVLMAIADYEDVFGVDNASPSIIAIAEATGMSRSTVMRTLKSLSDTGVIVTLVRRGSQTNRYTLNLHGVKMEDDYSVPTTPTSSLSREVSNPSGLSASRVEITLTPVVGRRKKVDPVRPGQIEDPDDTPVVKPPARLNAGNLGRRLVDGVAGVAPQRAGTMTYGAAGGYMKNLLKKGVPPEQVAEALSAFVEDVDVQRDLRSKPSLTVYAVFNSYFQRWTAKRPVLTDWDAEMSKYNQES